jgi:polyketide synthase PksJ
MAASSARNRAGLTHRESGGRKVDHPLLDRLIFDTPDRVVYHTKISVAKHWVLDEHRISGTAALPGTAFLEMARAAFGEYFERERIAIHDVFFLTPLIVREDESRDVFSVLERVGEAYDFRIISRDASNHAEKPVWREHARGKVGDLIQPIPDARLTTDALESLNKGAPGRDRKGPTDARGEMVQWGPRWNCVKTLMSRGNEVLARLELHDQFNADLAQLHLHPALLDVATSLGVRASGDNYLPLAYRRVEVHGPLSGTILVKVKVNENFASNAEILTFDALIMDPSGKLLVRVEAFSLKRVNDQNTWRNSGQNGTRDPRRDHARLGEAEARIYESLGFDRQLQREFDGILPHEGVAAFQRILSLGKVPQIIVSVTNLASASERPRSAPIASLELELPTQPSSVPSRNPRNLQSEFATPKNDPTSILASIWQEVLGIERVGVNDNFFELGGDSVIAIQVIAKANKAGFRLAINDIFQHQTVTELAVAAEASRGQEAAEHLEKQTFSPANEFGWTPEEKDRIARALIGSSN